MSRHEKSLLRTQARLAMELHHQEEHVAEADKARPFMSNRRLPISPNTPTVAKEVWRRTGRFLSRNSFDLVRVVSHGVMGSLQSHALASSVVRHVKVAEKGLNQRINYDASNAGSGCDSPQRVGG